jgi:hypothetical protein
MFMLSSEAALDGYDDRMLATAHAGLMGVIDHYVADQPTRPASRNVKPARSRVF